MLVFQLAAICNQLNVNDVANNRRNNDTVAQYNQGEVTHK